MQLNGVDPCEVSIALKLTLKFAVKKKWLRVNPLVGEPLRLPPRKRSKRFPTRQDLEVLLRSLLQPREHYEHNHSHSFRLAIVVLALFAGLRRGEIVALKWENVDFVSGVIKVRHSFCRWTGLKEPKTKAGNRNVPMNDWVRSALVPIAEKQCWPETGYLFKSARGRPLYDIYSEHFKPAMRRAGLLDERGRAKFRFHDLRHAAVSLMIESGVSVKAVSSAIGHASPAVTMNVYTHLFNDNDEVGVAMDKIGQTFRKRLEPPPSARQGHDMAPQVIDDIDEA